MEPRLHKSDVRVRRRIMHHITRSLSKGDPNRKAAFDTQFKDLVHDAVTVVLASERLAVEALAAALAPNGDDDANSD